jgi:hypothetical protein
VSKTQIEEIILTRNAFEHNEMLGSTLPLQTEQHFSKNPVPAFADERHLAILMGVDGKPEFPVPLKVTRDNLSTNIDYVRQYCAFVATSRRR